MLASLPFLAFKAQPAEARSSSDLVYRVAIEGVSDDKLRALLKESSKLFAQRKTPPLSRMALEQRAREDRARIAETLKSEGYYAAAARSRIDFRASPIAITLAIETGTRFTVERFEIVFTDGREALAPDALQAAEASALAAGAPARAADILAAQARALQALQDSGYPFAVLRAPHYAIDLDHKTMAVRLDVEPGRPWRFGEIVVEGLKDVAPGYVLRKAPWMRGERFDASKLSTYRRALEGTALFRSVQVEAAPEREGQGGELPVHVTLAERKPRTIGVGVQYSTNEGPGGRIFWEHRNFMRRARTVELSVSGNPIRQALEGRYREPEFVRSDQALFTRLALSHEASDAFNARSYLGALGLERRLTSALFLAAALELERARIEDASGLSKVSLASLPLSGIYDTSDDVLDPSRGVRVRLKVAPATGGNHGPLTFLTVEGTAAGYVSVRAKPQTILAVRARLGTISGAHADDVPANRRFYAGGGGSLRAYGYRDAGPLDEKGDPLGGRAVTELGAELRIRVGKRLGVVPFAEGGNVYEQSLPRFDRFLWGAGLGVRYFSAVGPLRLDVAVPLNRRKGVDSAVQIYVSIGQAF